ncbi:Recombinase-related protein [Cupriavidus taiwanensis]|uniref:recombinase family protein n=1 Tax=Cupriavidus taiwanensis TaxID=164546 RepID=UPI000E18C7C1|nr:recombinase family protein [Cupriavidus taiwanensis]SPA28539.1 Recombinase-related protein [Cupriavidus taiwanensis]
MNAPATLAYSYARWSSAEQSKGDSQRRQLKAFQDYCERKGLTPAEDNFIDRGRSGYKAEHLSDTGELRRFLTAVETGAIAAGSVLVVESLDRLGRQEVDEAYDVFRSILRAGIRIVTLADSGEQEYVKGGGIFQILYSLIEMSRAHGESQRKAEMVGAAVANRQDAARKYKTPIGNSCPLWLKVKEGWRSYELDGTAYEERPERADVVRQIFRWAIDGYGKEAIARMLNSEPHKCPPFKADTKWKDKGQRLWGASSVDKILKNKATFGEYHPTTRQQKRGSLKGEKIEVGEPIAGYYPATVSVDTFYEAQAAIDGRRTAKATRQSTRYNVWSGIAKCEKCGSALHLVHKGVPPKGSTYLRCANSRRGVCKAKAVRLDQAEAVFRGMLLRLDALSLVEDSSAGIEKALRAAEGELVVARNRLKGLTERLEENPESDAIGRLVAKAEADVLPLEAKVEALKADLAAEQGIGWTEFLARLDLVSYEGRAKANALCKRLGVVVSIGASGYAVTKNGDFICVMDYREGEAGYLVASGFRGKFPVFVPISDVPDYAEREDADQARQDAETDEGQPAGKY